MVMTDEEMEIIIEKISEQGMEKIVEKFSEIILENLTDEPFNPRWVGHLVRKLQLEIDAVRQGIYKNNPILQRLIEIEKSIIGHSKGVQNVYDKFIELVKRQQEIEDILKSDHLMKIIKAIPNEEAINNLLVKIDGTELGKFNKYLSQIKDELQNLSDKFY